MLESLFNKMEAFRTAIFKTHPVAASNFLSTLHNSIPILSLHVLFLSIRFINNFTEISNISKELQDMPVTKLFGLAKLSN